MNEVLARLEETWSGGRRLVFLRPLAHGRAAEQAAAAAPSLRL
jgi:hypothetical protein